MLSTLPSQSLSMSSHVTSDGSVFTQPSPVELEPSPVLEPSEVLVLVPSVVPVLVPSELTAPVVSVVSVPVVGSDWVSLPVSVIGSTVVAFVSVPEIDPVPGSVFVPGPSPVGTSVVGDPVALPVELAELVLASPVLESVPPPLEPQPATRPRVSRKPREENFSNVRSTMAGMVAPAVHGTTRRGHNGRPLKHHMTGVHPGHRTHQVG
jgi:hypothetical protein